MSVGVESRSGLIGLVVKVVFLGCHPRVCGLGMGGVVLTCLQVGALLLRWMSIAVLPLRVVCIFVLCTQADF